MVRSNTSAMGIIFPNHYDTLIPELVGERLMASIPFASRYRMIDFVLSSMVNSGIDNISVLVRENYHSLMDHLGSGREWDLTRKNGGLTIWPPFAEKGMPLYQGRIDAIARIAGFLKRQKEKYVIMADTNIAVNFDFKDMIKKHIESGADVTCAYAEEEIPAMAKTNSSVRSLQLGMYYTFDLDGDDIKKISINSKEDGIQNFGMNIYCIDREILIKIVEAAYVDGCVYFERDILAKGCDRLKIKAYKCDKYM